MKKIILVYCIFISIIALSSTDDFIQRASDKKLWEMTQWQRLLHFNKNYLTIDKSLVDGMDFFLSPDGKTSAENEMRATINNFLDKSLPDNDEHPICRFPARFKWLNAQLGIATSAPKVSCHKLRTFIQQHNAQSASLVFSSFHLDSPASAYGHTLLRLNKSANPGSSKHHELLDNGINFAANMTTDNPLVYAIMGMIGGFKGAFTSIPYFYKIREYNDFESRDIWSYNLKMTPDEMQYLVFHIWELGSTYFDYYYFDENCAYYMLAALEVANPNWVLTDKMPLWVVPSETIKVLYSVPGLVDNISFRPSLRRRLQYSASQLTEKELELVLDIDQKRDLTLLKGTNVNTKTRVLDGLIDYVDFKYVNDVLKEKGENHIWKNQILSERSSALGNGINNNMPAPLDDSPHLSHSQHRLGFHVGESEEGGYEKLTFRFSYHDVLDPPIGMPRLSQIEMGRIELRYKNSADKLILDEFAVIDVETMNPWDSFSKKMSFNATLGFKKYNTLSCSDCVAPSLEAGSGSTFKFLNGTTTFGVDFKLAYDNEFHRSGFLIAAGTSMKTILWWNDRFVTKLDASIFQAPTQKNDKFWTYGQETRLHFIKDMSLVLSTYNNDNSFESSLGLNYFF